MIFDSTQFFMIEAHGGEYKKNTLNSLYTTFKSSKSSDISIIKEKKSREETLNLILKKRNINKDIFIFVDDIIFLDGWHEALGKNAKSGMIVGFSMLKEGGRYIQDFGYDLIKLDGSLSSQGLYKGDLVKKKKLPSFRKCSAICGCAMWISKKVLDEVNNFPLEGIKYQDIERYIDWLRKKGLNNTSINIHLRTVRTMLNYFSRIEKLKKVPIIQQLSVARPDPHYITENEFESILNLNSLDDFYKRVFLFYMETGMRLREIDIATLNGNWIDISSDSKSHFARPIPVNKEIASIFNELKKWLEHGHGSTINDYGGHLSKRFKKSLMKIEANKDKHFHSLRHTFAVRSLLKGVPIYEVQKLLGHSSVTTTEAYSNMNLKRVAQDFPSLNRKSVVDNHLVDSTLSEYIHLKQYVKIIA